MARRLIQWGKGYCVYGGVVVTDRACGGIPVDFRSGAVLMMVEMVEMVEVVQVVQVVQVVEPRNLSSRRSV
jgi:hypothetical protein